jgi:hypothetical protein
LTRTIQSQPTIWARLDSPVGLPLSADLLLAETAIWAANNRFAEKLFRQ